MSNLTNSDSLNAITSLEPTRREGLPQEAKGRETVSTHSNLQPQRRMEAVHPYQSPEFSGPHAGTPGMVGLASYPGRGMTTFIAALALIAFGLASYLTIPWFTESKVVGCNGSIFNCDSVLNSRYSNWLGLPVSGLAALTYASLLVALVFAQNGSAKRRDWMWSIVALCCLSAGAAALWFVFLQFFVLKHLCQYCLAAHACGLTLAITFLVLRPLGTRVNTQMGILALVGLVFLSVGQAVGKEAPTFIIEEHQKVVPKETHSVDPATHEQDPLETPEFDDVFEAPDFGAITPRRQPSGHGLEMAMISWFLPLASQQSLVYHPGTQEGAGAGAANQDPATEQGDKNSAGESKPTEAKDQDQANSNPENNSDGAAQTPAVPATESRRILGIAGGIVKLDVKQWPAVGNVEADYVCAEMVDYNCQHCRQTHAAVKAAKEKLGDNMAVIVLPLPLNTECNSQIQQTGPQFIESCLLAKLAVAVWKSNPEKFNSFHDWMFEGANAPTYAAALAQAESLVGKEELGKVLNSPLPDAYIQKHVQIYSRLGKGNIPKLMFETTSIVGLFQSPDHLVDILNRQGPLTPTLVEKKQ